MPDPIGAPQHGRVVAAGGTTAGPTADYWSVGRVPAPTPFVAIDPPSDRLLEVVAASGAVEASAAVPAPPNRGLDERPHLAALGSYVAVTKDTVELTLFDLQVSAR